MINLVKNELSKIFHKKAIYITLLITVGFMILNLVLTKFISNKIDEPNQDIQFYKEQLSGLDKNKPEDKELYTTFETDLKVAELVQTYEKNSWQAYIINKNAHDIIFNMLNNEGKQGYEQYKNQYDDFIQKLHVGDWKSFAKREIDEINSQIQSLDKEKLQAKDSMTQLSFRMQIEDLEEQKQVLEWRIEKDIPYGNSAKNDVLEQWLSNKQQLNTFTNQEKVKELSYEDKYSKQNVEEAVRLAEYHIQNGLDDNILLSNYNNRENLASEADSALITVFTEYGLFITIAIVIVAGTIVSEEFNKGTIKLLLVRPYKRAKILIAKFMACLIVLVFVYVFVALAQFVIGGFNTGFGDYIGKVQIYNFNTNSVETIGTFKYLMISGVSILPQFLLIMTLAFFLSVLFINSPIAIAFPMLGMMGAEIINQLAYNYEKAKFLRFFVTPNWDLSIYLFGKLPEFEPINLLFSVGVCVVYFVAMIAMSLAIFNKREIKNI